MIDYETLKTTLERGNTHPDSYVTKTYGIEIKGMTIKLNGVVIVDEEYGYPTMYMDKVYSFRLDYMDLYNALKTKYQSVVVAGCDEDLVYIGYNRKKGEFFETKTETSDTVLLPNGKPLSVPSVYSYLTIEKLKEDLVDELTEESPISAITLKRCKCCGHMYIVDWAYASYIWRKGWVIPTNCTACRTRRRTNVH